VVTITELFILIYRFLPATVSEQLRLWQGEDKWNGNPRRTRLNQKIKKLNRLVNALNIKLHKALRQDDTTFVSRTMLESTRYRPQNIVVLRAVLINPLTEKAMIHEIVQTQRRLGLKLWKNFEPAYERLVKNMEIH